MLQFHLWNILLVLILWSPFQLIEYLLETLSQFVYHLYWYLSSSGHSEARLFYIIMQCQWFFSSWTNWVLSLTDEHPCLYSDDSTYFDIFFYLWIIFWKLFIYSLFFPALVFQPQKSMPLKPATAWIFHCSIQASSWIFSRIFFSWNATLLLLDISFLLNLLISIGNKGFKPYIISLNNIGNVAKNYLAIGPEYFIDTTYIQLFPQQTGDFHG